MYLVRANKKRDVMNFVLSSAKMKPPVYFPCVCSLFSIRSLYFKQLFFYCSCIFWNKLMILFTLDSCNRWPFNDCFSSGWNFICENLLEIARKKNIFLIDSLSLSHSLVLSHQFKSISIYKTFADCFLFFASFIIRNGTHLLKWLGNFICLVLDFCDEFMRSSSNLCTAPAFSCFSFRYFVPFRPFWFQTCSVVVAE